MLLLILFFRGGGALIRLGGFRTFMCIIYILEFPAYVVAMSPPPPVVLLDQNLDHPTRGGPLAKGTDLVPRLRAAGFEGKIMTKSANASSKHRVLYSAAGRAAPCCCCCCWG